MSFLQKLGKVLATIVNIAGVAAGIGPLIGGVLGSKAAGVVSQVTNDLTSIGQVVVTAEALIQTPGSGATKLAAATPLVAQIIQTSEMIAGHKIQNEALFISGSQKVTSGVADILNALSSANVPNPGTTPAAPVVATPPVQG